MDHLTHMVVFAKVVETKGFGRAARLMGLSTSSVSRSVSALEARVGGRLLNRTTRSLSMTELGDAVYARCAQIAETAREVETVAATYAAAPQGLLRVTAPIVVGQALIAPLMPGFLCAYPEVDVRLTLTDEIIDLAEEGVDVAIRLPIATEVNGGLVARPLTGSPMILVASPKFLSAFGEIERPERLADCEVLTPGGLDAAPELSFASGEATVRVRRSCRFTANNMLVLMTLARAGFGVALLPERLVRGQIAGGRLRQVLPGWSLAAGLPTGQVQIVYAPTRHLPKKTRVFIDYLVEAIKGA
jgi:DNA-binding transcriptional LysR family regulator